MRRIFLLIASVCALAANAQMKMNVYLNSGRAVSYDKTSVDSIAYGMMTDDDLYCGHEYADLGLPSGLKWATCNIGAAVPEDYGDFYKWGETKTYDWNSNYKFQATNLLTKYNIDGKAGKVDNKTVLEPEDDAAHAQWGGVWRMPTREEMEELINGCDIERITVNGINMLKLTSRSNGNNISMPLGGYCQGETPVSRGAYGYYWSASLNTEQTGSNEYNCNTAYIMQGPVYNMFGELCFEIRTSTRIMGCSVRAVAESKDREVMKVFLKTGTIDAYDIAEVDSVTFGTLYDNDKYRGHEYVDLGLPSGLKWATCNIGASAPEEYGDYYRWGETETRNNYGNKYINGNTILKYNVDEKQGTVDNKTVLDPEDDAAHVVWGGAWRMPTEEETKELRNSCKWEETTLNGVNVTKITGSNGNCIYLPYTGFRIASDTLQEGESGRYWSSSLNTGGKAFGNFCNYAAAFGVPYAIHVLHRSAGASIRAVAE